MRQFGRDENGSMIVFSLYLLVVMLILGGMAVDFMRFESRRSMLQGVSDRAALAGASLRNSSTDEEAEAIALDYFVKAGLDQYLVGQPTASGGDDANYRAVQVKAEMELDTFFLKLVGIDALTAGSSSKAIEGVGNVEISLVVDISGSMRETTHDENGTPLAQTKMQALQEAAKAFTAAIFTEQHRGKISLSLVPYSADVNIGPTLFGRVTNKQHDHDYSHCLNIPDSEFASPAWNTSLTYTQVQHFQYYDRDDGTASISNPVCPRYTQERVIFMSQNKDNIDDQIELLAPRNSTSIHLGLKWGAALLDPSTRAMVAGGQEGEFSGRPFDYPSATNPDSRTEKFIVLMTDGDNQWSYRLDDEHYDTPSEIAHWEDYNLDNWTANYATNTTRDDWTYVRYTAPKYLELYGIEGESDADQLTKNLCDAAKLKGIQIHTIAFEATSAGESLMSYCASSPSHYHNASGSELVSIFEAIAAQITDLRLTL
ncbi:TadE/TadG family type IV pilus assembly protein [Yoonia sp. 208BN28-4]|uniref:TadE/TadG family type IV pilus assembly protein n=1 Tax=Yoonia sp. 208BN28-4 TaxID=3126505 RepID=UPI0030ED7712